VIAIQRERRTIGWLSSGPAWGATGLAQNPRSLPEGELDDIEAALQIE
jgi:hypothetical protein